MKVKKTKWESLSSSSVYDAFEEPWDCDLFSVLADQANTEIDSIGRGELSEYIGDHISRFKKYNATTAELFSNDLRDCFQRYLKGYEIALKDITIRESTKEIPDALVNISKSGSDHEIEVSSAFLYYLNFSFQIYRFLGKPTISSDVTHKNRIEMAFESMMNFNGVEMDNVLDKHFLITHLKNIKNFYSPDPNKKLDIIDLPSEVIEIPILLMYARHFMLMHEVSHILLDDQISDSDSYLQEILVDDYAIKLMLNGIAKSEQFDDLKKTTETKYMLVGILTFLHCQSMHYRYYDLQESKVDSIPLMPNPIIREMGVIRTFYSKTYLQPGSFLPCELLKTLFELNAVTFEPEYYVLSSKQRELSPFTTPGTKYAFELYGVEDEEVKKMIPTFEKLRTNLFDILAPGHAVGKKILNEFLEIYLDLLRSAYLTGYFPNRGEQFNNLQEELLTYAYRFFEVRSEPMPATDRTDFLEYFKDKVDRILDYHY